MTNQVVTSQTGKPSQSDICSQGFKTPTFCFRILWIDPTWVLPGKTVFLASVASSYMSGAELVVAGGLSLLSALLILLTGPGNGGTGVITPQRK